MPCVKRKMWHTEDGTSVSLGGLAGVTDDHLASAGHVLSVNSISSTPVEGATDHVTRAEPSMLTRKFSANQGLQANCIPLT